MAAPRRYSDAQRAAMFALYEQGVQPAEIARRCAEGLAAVGPFHIPRRTVQDVVTAMARERGRADLPRSIQDVLDGDSAELVARYPSVVLGLISTDCQRLRDKVARGGLSLDEYNRLRAGLAIHKQIVEQSRQPATQPKPRRGVGSNGRQRGARDGEESKLEEIGRALRDEAGAERSRENEHGDDDGSGRTAEAIAA